MTIVLYGRSHRDIDLIGQSVEIIEDEQTYQIVAVNHYGFVLNREPVEMFNWYNENKLWRWADGRPEGEE